MRGSLSFCSVRPLKEPAVIVTLTLNPSIDRSFELPDVLLGQVNRADAASTEPGGKGINISRALAAQNLETLAVFPCGGHEGRLLVGLLQEQGVPCVSVKGDGETRTNITLMHSGGSTTKVNGSGPVMSARVFDDLVNQVLSRVKPHDVVVCSGSLPPGLSSDVYLHIARAVHKAGVRCVVDTSGPALRTLLAAESLQSVELIKPNLEELEDATGQSINTMGQLVDVVTRLQQKGLKAALVTLGAGGAVLVDNAGAVWGYGPALKTVSTVGAGDMALVGYLSASTTGASTSSDAGSSSDATSAGRQYALRMAVAYGQAAVQLPGTATPSQRDLDLESITIVENPSADQALQRD